MVIPSVAYLDPDIARVGMSEDAAKAIGTEIAVARFPWTGSGRAIANCDDYDMTKPDKLSVMQSLDRVPGV